MSGIPEKPYGRHQNKKFASFLSKMISIYCLTLHKWRTSWILSPFEKYCHSKHSFRTCLLCGGGDLLFLLSPPAPPQLVSALTQKLHSDYFQIFAVCILALGNLPGKFAFFSFFNKIQDGRQNPMAHPTA